MYFSGVSVVEDDVLSTFDDVEIFSVEIVVSVDDFDEDSDDDEEISVTAGDEELDILVLISDEVSLVDRVVISVVVSSSSDTEVVIIVVVSLSSGIELVIMVVVSLSSDVELVITVVVVLSLDDADL